MLSGIVATASLDQLWDTAARLDRELERGPSDNFLAVGAGEAVPLDAGMPSLFALSPFLDVVVRRSGFTWHSYHRLGSSRTPPHPAAQAALKLYTRLGRRFGFHDLLARGFQTSSWIHRLTA